MSHGHEMSVKWKYTDGGRSKGVRMSPSSKASDCTVRALASASGHPYDECWDALTLAQGGDIMADGVPPEPCDRVYREFGFRPVNFAYPRTLRSVIDSYPDGIVLMQLCKTTGQGRLKNVQHDEGHTVALRRGRVLDLFSLAHGANEEICIAVYVKGNRSRRGRNKGARS